MHTAQNTKKGGKREYLICTTYMQVPYCTLSSYHTQKYRRRYLGRHHSQFDHFQVYFGNVDMAYNVPIGCSYCIVISICCIAYMVRSISYKCKQGRRDVHIPGREREGMSHFHSCRHMHSLIMYIFIYIFIFLYFYISIQTFYFSIFLISIFLLYIFYFLYFYISIFLYPNFYIIISIFLISIFLFYREKLLHTSLFLFSLLVFFCFFSFSSSPPRLLFPSFICCDPPKNFRGYVIVAGSGVFPTKSVEALLLRIARVHTLSTPRSDLACCFRKTQITIGGQQSENAESYPSNEE